MKEFAEQVFLVIRYGAVVLGVFVVLLLNSKRVRKSRANLFLSALLIALSFSILHNSFAGKVMHHFGVSSRTPGDPSLLLIAPALWFYIQEITGTPVRFSFRLLLHFFPFIGLIGLFLFTNSLPPDYPFIQWLKDHHRITSIFFWTCTVIQLSVYQFFMHRKWRAHQQLMVQEVSNTENVNISWVNFFMGVFLVINFFFLISWVLVIHTDNSSTIFQPIAILFSLSVFALGYKGILQKEIFHTAIETAPVPVVINTVVKPPDNNLMNQLRLHMEEKQPYLDAELNLSELAKQLNISRSQLSQLINEGTGDNFYNFINKYRVEKVKELMHDPAMKHFSMLGIALEAGFKSKSTFNLIFKRFTGLTPTEYRKNLQD